MYKVVIGLEVHVQLLTKSKIFCGCSVELGGEPNIHTCPICLGMPGVQPVLNRHVVELAIRSALALNCKIQKRCRFARKNYFYPDLPKGYQITQYSQPLSVDGFIKLDSGKKIRLKRLHLEEETGKSIHTEESTLIDFNRAGIPLIEIVTEPDISSVEEAASYLIKLKQILRYIEVSNCDMEKGTFRCEPNISIKKDGKPGVRTEIKNLNSFKAVERALSYEIERQKKILKSNGKIVQQTLLWDEKKEATFPMRTKEEEEEYRYFPEPDLLPVTVSKKWIEEIKQSIPELPDEKKSRFIKEYRIPEYDARILTSDRNLSSYYEECAKYVKDKKLVSNWIMTELLAQLKEKNLPIEEFTIKPKDLAELLNLLLQDKISGSMAKSVFTEMAESNKPAIRIVKEKGLFQIKDATEIEKTIDKVLVLNEDAVSKYKAGKTKVFGFLVGQVMKEMKGKANPKVVNELLKKKL